VFAQLLGNPVIVIGLIVLVGAVIGAVMNALITARKAALTKATMKPIMQAAIDGDIEQVTQLLATGEDVDVKTALGDTSLMWVRIPVEADHPYRSKPISDSAPSRSLIPEQADHPYRSQADHFRPTERNRA
jgi:hypothetical protein